MTKYMYDDLKKGKSVIRILYLICDISGWYSPWIINLAMNDLRIVSRTNHFREEHQIVTDCEDVYIQGEAYKFLGNAESAAYYYGKYSVPKENAVRLPATHRAL